MKTKRTAALVAAQYPLEDLDALITQRWDSLSTIGEVSQPILILHGVAAILICAAALAGIISV